MRGNYSSREEHDQVEAIFRDRRRRQIRARFRTVTNVVVGVASAIFVLAFYASLILVAVRRLVR